MDAWEKQLMQRTEVLVAESTLSQVSNQRIIIASDSSVKDHRASYGWVIATTEGTRIAKCNGPAFGYKPTSFRAEGYGLLSVLRFLYHSQQKWGWNHQYTILCDNKAMIDIMQELFKVDDTYPNYTLSAEWNVISEMKQTIDKHNLRDTIQFRHIKGHADKDHPYHKLSLMQQMNIDADKLAGDYIHTHPDESYHMVPILPNSGIQLNMPGGTVTYQLKKTVMQARPQSEHQKYLCQHNN
jgi:hypothetical protein